MNRRFMVTDHATGDIGQQQQPSDLIQFNWNRGSKSVSLQVDGIDIELPPNHITTFTYHHQVVHLGSQPLAAILFNRDFYCIADHDAEIGCNGILFFGTQDLPILQLDEEHLRKLDLLWQVIIDEFGHVDKVQGEMLQMLLKRFIIICTRLAKEQLITQKIDSSQLEIIRQFNVLVDLHFRKLRKVKDYADILHRSPKTLANLFGKYGDKSPSQIIQERVTLEAKRLLYYTDLQVQEIAYNLGFEEPAHFSKFFKKATGSSPQTFKSNR